MSDAEWIEQYIESGSETAFGCLVQKYLDLVYGTAQRQLQDVALAEEVTQQVFLLLARKIHSLRRHPRLAGWLYATTLFKARDMVKTEQRRRIRERESALLGLAMSDDDSLLKSMAGVLDEALMDLGEKDRQALLLRYFQCKNLREVGEDLGIKEDAAQKRVTKALENLARAFRKRGYAPATAVTTVAVLESASLPVSCRIAGNGHDVGGQTSACGWVRRFQLGVHINYENDHAEDRHGSRCIIELSALVRMACESTGTKRSRCFETAISGCQSRFFIVGK